MANYYQILFDDQEGLGVARTLVKGELFFLPDVGEVRNWNEPILELQNGDYPDYLASNLGCRMCSVCLKDILARYASPADRLQWLPVSVCKQGEERPYFILHFPAPPDVLDKDRTLYAGDHKEMVVKPVLYAAHAEPHSVFSYPRGGELTLLISTAVKRAIEAEGCTRGMEIAKVRVA
jgi:hypothetical protein